jgi:LCP family protein required for cell wall assembly
MLRRMAKARLRARRSRYRFTTRLSRSIPAVVLAAVVVGVAGGALAVARVVGFLNHVTGGVDPIRIVGSSVDPPRGSIAWKLKHGEQVNVLLLGYGGAENDAPYLTDSILAVTIDPAHKRVREISVPRDLWVKIDAWQDGRTYPAKINAAFEVGLDDSQWRGKSPQYTGSDGGGHLAEHVVGNFTGIQFDKYAAIDFKAFRDVVDALGGIDVHMDGPLDDCHYPDYHDGYLNHGVPPGVRCPRGAGIHFAAGDYAVNGEQALELARSREATQPDQASDFGRARRQQMIISKIKKKAISANGLTKVLPLMSALESNVHTDMDVTDLKALYEWGGKVPDSNIQHVALTDQDFLDDGGCGPGAVFTLCPEDPSLSMIHTYLADGLVDPKVLAERANIQVVNASYNSADLGERVTRVLRPLGFAVADPARRKGADKTVIYDYSGGKYPLTSAWLANYFGAGVSPAAAAPPPTPGQQQQGLVVLVARDYARRWYGLTP